MGEKNILLSNDHSLASTSTSATVQAILWRKDWCPCIPARFVIVLWCFLGLFCTYALRTTLSIAILAMVKEGDSEDSQDTGTKVSYLWGLQLMGPTLCQNITACALVLVTHFLFSWILHMSLILVCPLQECMHEVLYK